MDDQTKANTFCDECPVKECRDNFREYTITALENNPTTRGIWRKYGFNTLKHAVEEISSLRELPRSERSIKTHRLIQEFEAAKARQKRIDEENSKPTER
ncbi:MAG TPA: hypothetical protein VF692_06725 [Pyrinomonadaceae bacterium]